MACIVSYVHGGRVHVKGTRPRKPLRWIASAWFLMPDGVKHTHEATIPEQTVESLVPYMGQLIDTLIEDHGTSVKACGWSAAAHGRRPRQP